MPLREASFTTIKFAKILNHTRFSKTVFFFVQKTKLRNPKNDKTKSKCFYKTAISALFYFKTKTKFFFPILYIFKVVEKSLVFSKLPKKPKCKN